MKDKMKIIENKINLWKFLNFDSSLLFLIISNLMTIFFAITNNWNLLMIMWIYWFQSIIIGIFNFIKILTLKNFTTENFKINDRSVEPTKWTKYYTAFFFLIHYGGFHLGYMIFLLVSSTLINNEMLSTNNTINMPYDQITRVGITSVISSIDFLWILIISSIFFFNHLFSYIKNHKEDSKKIKNIGRMMFFPYARIIPMHLTIVFGFFLINSATSILFFMILKTLADIIMHQVEHKL